MNFSDPKILVLAWDDNPSDIYAVVEPKNLVAFVNSEIEHRNLRYVGIRSDDPRLDGSICLYDRSRSRGRYARWGPARSRDPNRLERPERIPNVSLRAEPGSGSFLLLSSEERSVDPGRRTGPVGRVPSNREARSVLRLLVLERSAEGESPPRCALHQRESN